MHEAPPIHDCYWVGFRCTHRRAFSSAEASTNAGKGKDILAKSCLAVFSLSSLSWKDPKFPGTDFQGVTEATTGGWICKALAPLPLLDAFYKGTNWIHRTDLAVQEGGEEENVPSCRRNSCAYRTKALVLHWMQPKIFLLMSPPLNCYVPSHPLYARDSLLQRALFTERKHCNAVFTKMMGHQSIVMDSPLMLPYAQRKRSSV